MTSKSTTTRRRARAAIAGAATAAAAPAIAAGNDATIQQLRDDLERRDREHTAAFDALDDAREHQRDTSTLEAAEAIARDAWDDAVHRFLDAPARTPRDVLLKLEWALDMCGLLDPRNSIHPEVCALAAAARDLRAIAGQGGDYAA